MTRQCEVCNEEKKDLGLFQGLYCCKECFKDLIECNANVLSGKYIIFQKTVYVR